MLYIVFHLGYVVVKITACGAEANKKAAAKGLCYCEGSKKCTLATKFFKLK